MKDTNEGLRDPFRKYPDEDLTEWAKRLGAHADERIADLKKQIAEKKAVEQFQPSEAKAPKKATKRRRTKGHGSVFQRGGIWYAEYKHKRRRYVWSSRSERKTDAVKLLDDNRRKILAGTYQSTVVTLGDLRDAVVADMNRNGRTSVGRTKLAFKHLVRLLGVDALADELQDKLDKYIETRLAEPVGKAVEGKEQRYTTRATVNRELAYLRRGFILLHKSHRLAVKPSVTLMAENNIRTRIPSDAEVEAVIAQLPGGLADAVRLLSIVPWRVSEALNLRWAQVDEEEGMIRQEAVDYKSGREARFLPYAVLPALADLLEERRRLTDEWDREHSTMTPWVFWYEGEDEHGQPAALPYSQYQKTWDRACKRAKIADFHVHDLKRYSAREMKRAAIDDDTVMALAGWRSVSMLRRYSIRTNQDLVDGMKKLAQAKQDRATASKRREA